MSEIEKMAKVASFKVKFAPLRILWVIWSLFSHKGAEGRAKMRKALLSRVSPHQSQRKKQQNFEEGDISKAKRSNLGPLVRKLSICLWLLAENRGRPASGYLGEGSLRSSWERRLNDTFFLSGSGVKEEVRILAPLSGSCQSVCGF